jgi:flagellar M-ring protein FliF
VASNDLVKRVQQIGRRLTPLQRIAIGAVTVTAIAASFVLSRSGTQISMAPLFTDLTSADASAVVDQLSTDGVTYDLTDAGHTVLVPSSEVYNLRVAMAGAGLPSSNEGYALLDKQGITTSEFRQQVDYQRAIEGELAKTLEAMKGIRTASVHLALPAESVFVEEQASPTAAVLIVAQASAGITGDEVQAIIHLVSSSVKNMKPEDVTVVDADGVVLSAAGSGMTGASVSGRSEVIGSFESEMAASITALLVRTTGAGKVAVTVNAALDLDEVQSTSENYGSIVAGDTGTEVMNNNVSTEIYGPAAATSNQTGILGPDGAVVTPAAPAAPLTDSGYQKGDQQRTYALDRVVETVTKMPGAIQRLSVAVLVDDTAVSAAQAAEIEKVVAAAAGIDPTRGDAVIVSRVPFDVSGAAEATALSAASDKTAKSAQTMELIRTGVVALVVIIALFLAYRSAKRARRVTSIPIQVGQITARRDAMPELEGAPGAILAERQDPMSELGEVANRRPDEVARVLRAWLAEGKVSQQ